MPMKPDGQRQVILSNEMNGLSKQVDGLSTDWHDHAACVGLTELFFDGDREREAKAVCRECPVIDECLSFALASIKRHHFSIESGIWGGLNAKERRALQRAGGK